MTGASIFPVSFLFTTFHVPTGEWFYPPKPKPASAVRGKRRLPGLIFVPGQGKDILAGQHIPKL
jgi:hypothetical protein